jgi:hypothetical protein
VATEADGLSGRHDDDDDASYSVRPYAMVGGRAKPVSSVELPVEALVEGLEAPDVTLTPERRRILELTATQYLSVMELSAHVKLPVGIVRMIVSDLAESKKVRVHGLTPSMSTPGSAAAPDDNAATLSILESVLNGISSL